MKNYNNLVKSLPEEVLNSVKVHKEEIAVIISVLKYQTHKDIEKVLINNHGILKIIFN